MQTNKLIILTGPTGSGKSTLAKALVKNFPKGVVIKVDEIKHCIETGFLYDDSREGKQQWDLCTQNIINLTQSFLNEGYDVIIEGFLGNHGADAWKKVFQALPISSAFLLLPSVETTIQRDNGRNYEVAMGEEAVKKHHEHFSDKKLFEKFKVVNTSEEKISESVKSIQTLLNNAPEVNYVDSKKHDAWNFVKKITNTLKRIFFKEREIWFIRMGENIGREQNGMGKNFTRPVIVLKKFNHETFWGVPLTTKQKQGKYHYKIPKFNKLENFAILSQMRLFDTKRLEYRAGSIPEREFEVLKKRLIELIQ